METFAERLLESRKAAGFGDSYRQAGKALEKAEKAGFGKAVHFNTIRDHEIIEDRMPGADVVVCYGAAFGVNPIWLATGIGPREWDAGSYGKESAEKFAAEVRRVARWMLRVSADDDRFREIVAAYDEPTLDDPRGGEDGKGGAGSVGTPRRQAG